MKKSTSKIIFLSALFASLSTWGQVSAPLGDFQFKKQLNLVTVKKTEIVQIPNRVEELKRQGWTCQVQAAQVNKCWIFLKDQNIPAEVQNQLQNKYRGFKIQFGAVEGIDQVNNADFLQEYSIAQRVNLNEQSLNEYILQVIKDGPTKIKLEAGLKKVYLISLDPNLLVIQEGVVIKHNTQSILYLVEVGLEH